MCSFFLAFSKVPNENVYIFQWLFESHQKRSCAVNWHILLNLNDKTCSFQMKMKMRNRQQKRLIADVSGGRVLQHIFWHDWYNYGCVCISFIFFFFHTIKTISSHCIWFKTELRGIILIRILHKYYFERRAVCTLLKWKQCEYERSKMCTNNNESSDDKIWYKTANTFQQRAFVICFFFFSLRKQFHYLYLALTYCFGREGKCNTESHCRGE